MRVTGKKEICDFLSGKAEKADYLVQPLLVNHPFMEGIGQTVELITLRVITAWVGQVARCLFAVVEIPVEENDKAYQLNREKVLAEYPARVYRKLNPVGFHANELTSLGEDTIDSVFH